MKWSFIMLICVWVNILSTVIFVSSNAGWPWILYSIFMAIYCFVAMIVYSLNENRSV